jgi:hypothetical protein
MAIGLCSVVAMMMVCAIVAGTVPRVGSDPSLPPVLVASGDRPMTTILEELTPRLMALPGVVGVGEGRCDGQPCIKVLVAEKTEDLLRRIRDITRDTPVDIVETGEIRAHDRRD